MSEFLDFILLRNPTAQVVLLGMLMICFTASLVGNFTFLRKRAMIGDAISHSVLPGVCLSFIISGEKDPLSILIYSTITGLIAMFMIDFIGRQSKIKVETAIAIVLSIFFGVGIMLISYIQANMGSAQSGLQHFFFGQAAAISEKDNQTFLVVTLIICVSIVAFFNGFKYISFDKEHARSVGYKVKFYETALSILTVMAIAIGVNAVGVILMAALLITPASTARLWTNNLVPMMIISLVLSVIAAFSGTYISYAYTNMPTGPWVVVFLSLFAFTSILFAPKRGVFSRLFQRLKLERRILQENILKSIYKAGEKNQDFMTPKGLTDIASVMKFDGNRLQKGLNQLKTRGLVKTENSTWVFTADGLNEGKRIVRVHRLWEMYLSNKLHLSSDHVHPSAESMEHVITPEMEEMLQKELNFPEKGPHNDIIPK